MNSLLITTGDSDGIGLEICLKALVALDTKSPLCIAIWCSDLGLFSDSENYLNALKNKFNIQRGDQKTLVPLLEELRKKDTSHLVIIESDLAPWQWVKNAAEICFTHPTYKLVTAPMSKVEVSSKVMGHTEILGLVTGVNDLRMAFLGDQFNVVLHTGHIPLRQVPDYITESLLEKTLQLTRQLVQHLGIHNRPIGLLGLNPHGGEDGKIGTEDLNTVKPFCHKNSLSGPLVPDVAFQKGNQFAVLIALYHDQGLIPFKLAHGLSGVHVTLGLPFLRTSVDHGTAKDIFNKGCADHSSLLQAIHTAINWVV